MKYLPHFKFRWGINAIINLQHPGEHANCGFGLENSGFTYNPEDFMNSGSMFDVPAVSYLKALSYKYLLPSLL
jgi:hypothetical protein